jgi:hypothetical protein
MHKTYLDTILGGFQNTRYCKSQSLCIISDYYFFKSRKLVSKVLLKTSKLIISASKKIKNQLFDTIISQIPSPTKYEKKKEGWTNLGVFIQLTNTNIIRAWKAITSCNDNVQMNILYKRNCHVSDQTKIHKVG